MHQRYGLWLHTGRCVFDEPLIWREDTRGEPRQTPFQRAVGVRYVGPQRARCPDAFTDFGDLPPRTKPRSFAGLTKGWFHKRPIPPGRAELRSGWEQVLPHATGYVLVASHRLQPVSKHGAVFVGFIRVKAA